jgi:hypothetical protein
MLLLQTGAGAHPESCYNVNRVFYLRVKRPVGGVNHPPASRAEGKERVELYLYSSSGP